MSNPPELSIDGREVELLNDDELSNNSIKAQIAWDHRDNEYCLVWWQSPFYTATPNGGYSMASDVLSAIPHNIETIWVVDSDNEVVRSFSRDWYENESVRTIISPDDPRFDNVTPDLQYAVDRERAIETFDIEEVPLP